MSWNVQPVWIFEFRERRVRSVDRIFFPVSVGFVLLENVDQFKVVVMNPQELTQWIEKYW